ncbi:pyridoxamine 5'-phosphate oxidase family protein [Sphingomonas piscis]|uniref:Pyridoxamine 5'-phosphate oxidase family protein n=1 Tax=Sphingomonas piscis TaxID=2714943 RepID=A0A6G7YLH4_9SPHN|nr:pyridoxamine 5'-phosphate oxidase family protein [Sphingomonas piscis]QIK77595.1 pyridoxamine 5'-phosphate oxidase family protein [Sphingomonas piscis]
MAEETQGEREERLRSSFWEALDDSPFMMLGLQGVEDSRTRPMTAQVDAEDAEDGGTLYFFAAKSEALGQAIGSGHRAVATYSSKDHKVFAHVHGTLVPANDRAIIERLWNPFIASWYKDGKDDPDLLLLRFDTERADVWEAHSGSTLVAAALKMLGRDPGRDHQRENQAEVAL